MLYTSTSTCYICIYSHFKLNGDLCLQPMIVRLPHFDSVSFISPDGTYIFLSIHLYIYMLYISTYTCSIYMYSHLD